MLSGAPHFFLEKGNIALMSFVVSLDSSAGLGLTPGELSFGLAAMSSLRRWYPQVIFPWDEQNPVIQHMWDRKPLPHASFTLIWERQMSVKCAQSKGCMGQWLAIPHVLDYRVLLMSQDSQRKTSRQCCLGHLTFFWRKASIVDGIPRCCLDVFRCES
jgi:hypothetical protein